MEKVERDGSKEKLKIDMKFNIIVILFFVCSLSTTAQKKVDTLADTRWKFIGLLYISDSTLHSCPNSILYTIDFKLNNKITGMATVPYSGKYKIKKRNYLKVRFFISKSTPSDKYVKGELDCRFSYWKYLSRDSQFILEDEKLKIVSNEYVTMIFESIK